MLVTILIVKATGNMWDASPESAAEDDCTLYTRIFDAVGIGTMAKKLWDP